VVAMLDIATRAAQWALDSGLRPEPGQQHLSPTARSSPEGLGRRQRNANAFPHTPSELRPIGTDRLFLCRLGARASANVQLIPGREIDPDAGRLGGGEHPSATPAAKSVRTLAAWETANSRRNTDRGHDLDVRRFRFRRSRPTGCLSPIRGAKPRESLAHQARATQRMSSSTTSAQSPPAPPPRCLIIRSGARYPDRPVRRARFTHTSPDKTRLVAPASH